MKMKNTTYLSLTTSWGKTYDKLILEKSKYLSNNRTSFHLFDDDENEPGSFCDISENHPEIESDIDGLEAIVIDNDFISCFPSERACKIWIGDNIPECVTYGYLEGRPVFYIKQL